MPKDAYPVCDACRRRMENGRCPKCGGKTVLWVAVLDAGRRPDGRRDRRFFYGRTKASAGAKRDEAAAQLASGTLPEPGRITVAEYLDRWLQHGKARWQPRTYGGYEMHVRLYLRPALGSLQLKRLTPLHLQDLYQAKLDAGLHPQTVLHLHRCAHAALAQAVRWRLIPTNPADAVEPPRVRRRPRPTLTADQAAQLLDALSGDRLLPLYATALYTGMRQSEILGLRWEDVDLERGVIHLRQVAQWIGRERITKPPKSGAGRSIAMAPDLIPILRAHRRQQAAERLQAGEFYQDHGLVFCQPDGRPLRPWDVWSKLRRTLDRTGLPRVTFHDLRHTTATLLLQAGVHPKVVAEMLGHSTIRLTLDTYSHVLPTMQAEAAEKLSVAIGNRRKEKGPRA